LISLVCVCLFGGVGFLWKEEGGEREGIEKKVNRKEKLLYVQAYIVPTTQNDKNPIGNDKNQACNILAGGGLEYSGGNGYRIYGTRDKGGIGAATLTNNWGIGIEAAKSMAL
jgi:hypothetical protein